jgi:hypothetical protein
LYFPRSLHKLDFKKKIFVKTPPPPPPDIKLQENPLLAGLFTAEGQT